MLFSNIFPGVALAVEQLVEHGLSSNAIMVLEFSYGCLKFKVFIRVIISSNKFI